MTKNIAYVRVSDIHSHDSSTQRHCINEYAIANDFVVSEWREFHVSGSKSDSKARGIDELIQDIGEGDKVIVSDIARLGRDSTYDLLHTVTSIIKKNAELHFAYSKTKVTPESKNDMGSLFMVMGESFAAVKFAKERSQKAKAACDRRKKSGLANGRIKGQIVKSKYDEHSAYIFDLLDKETPKTEILKLLEKKKGVKGSRNSLYEWLRRRRKQLAV